MNTTPPSVQAIAKPAGTSLNKLLTRLIWLCIAPLLLLASYLALSYVGFMESFYPKSALWTGIVLFLALLSATLISFWGGKQVAKRLNQAHKAALDALLESEKRLQLFIEYAPAGIAMFDCEMRYLAASQRWRSDYGLGQRHLMGECHYDFFPTLPERWKEIHRRCMAGEMIRAEEDRFESLDASVQWLRWEVRPWYDLQGHIGGIIIFAEDITERKLAEETIRDLNAELAATLQAIPDLLFEVDESGTYHSIWAQNPTLLAQQKEILLGNTINAMLPDEAASIVMASLAEAGDKGYSFGRIIELDLPNGVHWFELSVSVKTRGTGDVQSRFMVLSRDVTKRKLMELQLQHSEEKLRAITDNVDLVMFLKDAAGRYLYVNRQFEKLFHVTNASIQGKTDHELFSAEIADLVHKNDQQVIASGQTLEIEEQVPHDGIIHSYMSIKVPIRDAKGRIYAITGISTDITARKQIEIDLRIAAAAFESQEGMMVTDACSVILRVNRAFTDITGYTAEEAIGQTPTLLHSGRHDAAFYRNIWDSIHRTGGWQGEVWDRRKNGEEYPKWLNISAVHDDHGVVTHYVGTHYDITERKRAEEKIKELAFFDPLTGLPNRTLLHDRLKQAMTISQRNGTFGAVLFIDLDDFKTLNDTLGHDQGDLLLKEVAQRLSACVRQGDTVARLGGDEFVVVLENLHLDAQEAASQTELVGKKILATLNQTYQLAQVDQRSTASIGATLFVGHETLFEDLLKQADLAMYKSKNSGRNTLRFFDPAMQMVVMKRAALEKDLHQGVLQKQFSLHYQAQVTHGELVGSEVLLRWQHPLRGMVSPADFIPLAEETGFILPLGQWVLDTACAQLALWANDPKMVHLTLAVNVSSLQFRQNNFVDQVLAALHNSGANPHRLKLELTESLLVDNLQIVIDKMRALKAQGIGFSLDDFGTGYSSLAYLKKLPLDQLKIDQSFVRDLLTDVNDAAIARTIVALAESLGLGVIAEGVELPAQRDLLASLGCHAYQGYLFSRPLPLAGFETFAHQFVQFAPT